MATTDTVPTGSPVYDETEPEGDEYGLFVDLVREVTRYRGGGGGDDVDARRARTSALAYLTLAENAFSELVDARNAEFDRLAQELVEQRRQRAAAQ